MKKIKFDFINIKLFLNTKKVAHEILYRIIKVICYKLIKSIYLLLKIEMIDTTKHLRTIN